MDQLSENKNDLWNLIESKIISFDDFEKMIYSDSYLKALDRFDFNYQGSIYQSMWNLYEVKSQNKENIFFQKYLDKDVSESQYFQAEKKAMSFLKQFYNLDANCVAFYDFNSDSLTDNFPAQQSKNVLPNWDDIERSRGSFVKIDDILMFEQISYLGIREIGTVFIILTKSKIILIPNECRCTVLSVEPLKQSIMEKFNDLVVIRQVKHSGE